MRRSSRQKTQERILRAIDEYHAVVYRVAYRVVGNSADAEDVAQEVYLALVERPELLRSVRSLRSYLVRAALNRARSFTRRRSIRERKEEVWMMRTHASHRGDDGIGQLEKIAVREAIAELPDELRVPLVLHYEEGLKYREIAAVLGCPRGTVADRLATARERLRPRLARGSAPLAGKELEALLRRAPEIPVSPSLAGRIRDEVLKKVSVVTCLASATGAGLLSPAGIATGMGVILATGISLAMATYAGGDLIRHAGETAAMRCVDPSLRARDEALRWRRSLERIGSGRPDLRARDGVQADAQEAAGRVAPPEHGFFGWVRDDGGKPIAGATLRYVGPDGAVIATARSGEDGSYALEVPPFEADGVAAESFLAILADEEAYGFFLPRRREWLGALRYEYAKALHTTADTSLSFFSDAPGESYVAAGKAHVNFIADMRRSYESPDPEDFAAAEATSVRLRTASERSSAYLEELTLTYDTPLVESLVDITYAASPESRLEVVAPGFIAAGGAAKLPPGERASERVDFVLPPAKELRGRVVTGDDDDPLPGARVRVVGWPSEDGFPEEALETETGPDGTFRFDSLPAGTYILEAAADGFLAADAVVASGAPARLALERAAELRVRVRDRGGDLSEARVRLVNRGRVVAEEVAGEGGRAAFEGLRPGDWLLQVFRPEQSSVPFLEEPVLLLPGKPQTIELFLPDPVTVSGEIIGPDGSRVPAGEVRLHPLEKEQVPGDGCPSARPEEGGLYRVNHVPPGRYVALATARENGAPLAFQELFVGSGRETVRRDLLVDPMLQGALELSVTDAAGEPLRAVTCIVYREDAGAAFRSLEIEDGRCRIPLIAGSYAVEIESADHEGRRLEGLWVPAGGTLPVSVRLQGQSAFSSGRLESEPFRLREGCRLRTALSFIEESTGMRTAWSRAVEEAGILEHLRLEDFRGGILDLIEKVRAERLLVRPNGGGIWIDIGP